MNGLEPVVTVDTAPVAIGYRGRPTHRIKVVDPASGEWVWRRFGDVKAGELVPLALNSLVGEPQEVALPPLADAYWTGEHHVSVPRRMTPELAELAGYFMGDGSLHSRGLRFCVADTDFDVVERLQILAKECFGAVGQGHSEARLHRGPYRLGACGPVVGGLRFRQALPGRRSSPARATWRTCPTPCSTPTTARSTPPSFVDSTRPTATRVPAIRR